MLLFDITVFFVAYYYNHQLYCCHSWQCTMQGRHITASAASSKHAMQLALNDKER